MSQSIAEDVVLERTQALRLRLLDRLVGDGEVPTDKDTVQLILQTAADADRAALGNKRIKTEDKNAEADRLASKVIATIYSRVGNTNPFEVPVGDHVSTSAPAHPETLLDGVVPVPGELDQGISNMTFDTFGKEPA